MSLLRFNELRGEQVAYAVHRQDRTFLPDEDHCPLDGTRPGGPATEIPFPSFEIVVFDNLFPSARQAKSKARVQRYEELAARADIAYVLIFENRGVEVGTTLHHPHGQIYGFPFVPPVPGLELEADARLGGCAPCTLLERELADGERIVHANGDVVAYVPFAARWPYECHVVRGTSARRVLPAAADRHQAQVPRRLRAGGRHLHRGRDAGGFGARAGGGDRRWSLAARRRSRPAAST